MLRVQVDFLEAEKGAQAGPDQAHGQPPQPVQESPAAAEAADGQQEELAGLRQRLAAAEGERGELRGALLAARAQTEQLIAALRALAGERGCAQDAQADAQCLRQLLQLGEGGSSGGSGAEERDTAVQTGAAAEDAASKPVTRYL
jgi:hypothetical protein